jgi:formylglycine-generating enzyme required for sulfatase activity
MPFVALFSAIVQDFETGSVLAKMAHTSRNTGCLSHSQMAHEVFVSYSTKDKAVAESVCSYLEGKGISCWIAPRDIFGGQDFGAAITEAIQGCRIVVLIFSSAANASRQIGREMKLAVDNDKTVIPVRLENIPIADNFAYFLGAAQWLEAVEGLKEEHLQRLGNTILSYRRKADRPVVVAHAAESQTAAPLGKTYKEKQPTEAGWVRRYGIYVGLALVVLVAGTILVIRISIHTGKSKVNPDDGQRYAYISPGTFRMGCSQGDTYCFPNESPAHDVQITKGYWIQEIEVTVGSYHKFCARGGRPRPAAPKFPQGDDHPVVNVSWNDADTYCKGAGGRLPTEAEWEYAARAGTTEPRYGDLDEIAWYGKNSKGGTHPGGKKTPNRWGLYDMLGNAWEWCGDWYGAYSANPVIDPQGPLNGAMRVIRGAAWDSYVWGARTSDRGAMPPDYRQIVVGFRCVRDVMP